MGIAQTAVRSIKNIWSHGDDDDYEREEADSDPEPVYQSEPQREHRPAPQRPSYGGGAGGARRLSGPVPLRVTGREKQIYTLKPKSLDEASIAADYLKTGSAVVLNLDEVDRSNAVRIIDFMSGVCYGLDNQGHAMKLGDTIFLFTPGDFEISSDETDYGENPEFFFKEVTAAQSGPSVTVVSTSSASVPPMSTPAPSAPMERVVERPALERPVIERPSVERPSMERPSIERPTARPWER